MECIAFAILAGDAVGVGVGYFAIDDDLAVLFMSLLVALSWSAIIVGVG